MFAILTPVHAQTKEELALELAQLAINEQFKYIKPLMDGSLENLKQETKRSGKLDRVMEIWIDEMKGSMNPESFIQVLGAKWSAELTHKELQQILEIYRSPLYRKLSALSESMSQPKTLAPIIREACNRTKVRAESVSLSTRDLDVVCNQLAPQ